MKDQSRSGRTTRMVQYAIERMQRDERSCIIAHSQQHANQLRKYSKELLGDEWPKDRHQHLIFTSFDYASGGQHNILMPQGEWTMFDYRTNRFTLEGHQNIESVIDHFALEDKLKHIRRYLDTATSIRDHDHWLIDTAKMMSLDRRVYLIVQEEAIQDFIQHLDGFNVSVESGMMMSNLDWLELRLAGKANFYSQLLFRPSHLQEMFKGSLNEIHRWDK